MIRNLKQLVIINLGDKLHFLHSKCPLFSFIKQKTLNLFRLSVFVFRIAVLRGLFLYVSGGFEGGEALARGKEYRQCDGKRNEFCGGSGKPKSRNLPQKRK